MGMTEQTAERAMAYATERRDAGQAARVVALSGLANGYEPTDRRSKMIHEHAVLLETERGATLVVWYGDMPGDASSFGYVIDGDGCAQAWYVSGWNDRTGALWLRPYPTGQRHYTWMIPVKRYVHLKLSRNIPALAEFNGDTMIKLANLAG
jgi:hypothetical protein